MNGVDDSQTRTVGGVRSTEDMDRAINDLTTKFASMSTVLEEIRSAIGGGGKHPNREGNVRGNHRFRNNYEEFYENHERNQSPKQVWRQEGFGSSDEEGDGDYGVLTGGPRGRNHGLTVLNNRNEGQHDYGDRHKYRVKVEIHNFLLGILILKLCWIGCMRLISSLTSWMFPKKSKSRL